MHPTGNPSAPSGCRISQGLCGGISTRGRCGAALPRRSPAARPGAGPGGWALGWTPGGSAHCSQHFSPGRLDTAGKLLDPSRPHSRTFLARPSPWLHPLSSHPSSLRNTLQSRTLDGLSGATDLCVPTNLAPPMGHWARGSRMLTETLASGPGAWALLCAVDGEPHLEYPQKSRFTGQEISHAGHLAKRISKQITLRAPSQRLPGPVVDIAL